MATKGQTITNKITGDKIKWIQTSKDTQGRFLRFDIWVPPLGNVPIRHIHPHQDEIFEIRSGTIKFECEGKITVLTAGDRYTVKRNQSHQYFNESFEEEVHMAVMFEPANNTEIFFEQLFGLCNDNKANSKGGLTFLQIMAMTNEYDMRISGPPLFIQKFMGKILGSLAKVLGYKSFSPKYSTTRMPQL